MSFISVNNLHCWSPSPWRHMTMSLENPQSCSYHKKTLKSQLLLLQLFTSVLGCKCDIFLLPTPILEYPSWTFGHENITSYSTFNISETHGDNFTISFLMRSLKHNGLLLQLSREGKSYLTIYLKEGTVAIYSPYTTLLSEAKFVTDGNNNLVTIKVRYGHVVFPKAGNHRALGNVSVEAGDVAYVGGLPLDKSINNWGGNFKGCLQDIRLDHKYLTFEEHPDSMEVYQASTEENVLRGCQSDDTCKVKEKYRR